MDFCKGLWSGPFPFGVSPAPNPTPATRTSCHRHERAEPLDDKHDSTLFPSNELPASNLQVARRKGHTKSRLGCLNCKRRRIKCAETRPSCPGCEKAGLRCEYPRRPASQAMVHPSPRASFQATPTIFSMADMRAFHHFLWTAYPHLPVGEDRIWTFEIPAVAHEVHSRRPPHSLL